MPTERFYNLPEEKQERIKEAGKKELSRVPVFQMSINQIIRSAGIPRGSFYQYFSDKLDLLVWIMQEYVEEVEESIEEKLKNPDVDIMNLVMEAYDRTIEFGTKAENYAFCKNIFSHLRIQGEFPFEVLHMEDSKVLDRYLPYINVDVFKYTSKEEIEDMFEIVIVLIRNSIAKVFLDVENKEEIRARLLRKLTMLKYGIIKDEEMEREE